MFKRVAAVNTANGPFDMLLCSGGFFIGKACTALPRLHLATFAAYSLLLLLCR